MPVSFSDLQLAFEFVSSGGMREIEAYLDRHSGKIYWHSEFGDNDEELPDDIDDEKYIFGAGGHERSYFPHYLEPRKTSEKAPVRSSRKLGWAASRPGVSTTWCRRWACPAFEEPSLKLCKDIDERVNVFLHRPIKGKWPYLWLPQGPRRWPHCLGCGDNCRATLATWLLTELDAD